MYQIFCDNYIVNLDSSISFEWIYDKDILNHIVELSSLILFNKEFKVIKDVNYSDNKDHIIVTVGDASE